MATPSTSPPSSAPAADAQSAQTAALVQRLHRSTLGLIVALGLPLVVLLALVLFLLDTAKSVDHSDRVIAEMNHLERLLVGLQADTRGHLLLEKSHFMNEIRNAHEEFEKEQRGLLKSVSDNPQQTERAERFRESSSAWIDFVDATFWRAPARPVGDILNGLIMRGTGLMRAALQHADEFVEAEEDLRQERSNLLQKWVAAIFVTLGLLSLAGVPLLFFWLREHLRTIRDSYQASLESAERQARELQITLNSIGDAVVATDAKGQVDFLNPTAETLTGWGSAEARGRPLAEVFTIFNERTRKPVESPVERVLRENIVVGLANHTVLRGRGGREYPIEDSAAPIRAQDGSVAGVILVFHDVTEKRETARRLEESESRLRILNEIGERTRALLDPAEIMAISTELLGRHMDASRCAYADVERDGEYFTIQKDYTDGCASTAGRYQLSHFGPRAVADLHGGRTLILRDVQRELKEEEGAATFAQLEIQAIICCPLLKDGRLNAMMEIQQTTPRAWTLAEILLVQEVVERCWSTIERARAEGEALERAKLSVLRAEIADHLSRESDLEPTLQRCCELLVSHLDAAFARIWLTDAREPVLILRASAGLYTHLDGGHGRVRIGDFKIGRIAQSRQAHLTNDVQQDPNVSNQEWARREGMVAFAGYPLLVEGRVLGVVALFSRHVLSENVLGDLDPIANTLAQHIERKRAEASLQASETIKSAILDTALDGFVLMDHTGCIRDWNDAAARIFKASREEVMGRVLSEIMVPPELRQAHHHGLQHYLATGEAKILGGRFEVPALRSDGDRFPCEISITHVPRTEPPLFAGYVRDITDRKDAEQALRQAVAQAEVDALAAANSTERFRLLAEVTSLQVWTAEPNGNLDFVNKQCLQYFGAGTEEELLGTVWQQWVHEDDLEAAGISWVNALSTGERYEVEFRLRQVTGEYRWFLARAEALRDAEGVIIKWFGTNTDIHALKTAQSAAERANRAKDDFLAALSHELRTPLNPVLMTAAALREEERLPQDVRDQLGMIERNIALEARLIDDLLDLTRIARGKLSLRTELCDAHSLIGLAVEIVRDDALAKGIVLKPNLRAQKSGLIADPARFQQVIWNLLRNAVKFTPRGGKIAIRTLDQDENWLRIEVTDSGVGINAEELQQIFRPFEQGGRTGDHRFGGLGLGLAIARAVVDLHGGRFVAHSTGAGQGATFIVDLPGAGVPPHGVAEEGESEGDSAAKLVAPAVARTPLRILLVEDHLPTLQVLQRLLTREGHAVVTAGTITEALARAATQTFDVAISDLGLPDGTGNELMQQLKAQYRLYGIALSGYGMEEDIVRSRQSGFSMHLIKPVDFQQLRRALSTLDLTNS